MASCVLYSGLSPQVINCQEGASAGSFVDGDLVKTDSAGQVVIASAGKVLGIARKTATGTQATVIPVELIDFHSIYTIPYKASPTAQTVVGVALDLTYGAGAHTATDASSSALEVECVGLHPGDVVTTSGGRLLVRFKSDKVDAR